MNPYKCESHKLDLICGGCVKAYIARHDAMLRILKTIDADGCGLNECTEISDLLKEIGR